MKEELNWQKGGGFDYVLYKAKTEKPSSLIIYLHGMADNATHFTPWARAIQKKLPDADIIVVQAPIEIQHPRVPPGEKGYAWVPIQQKRSLAKTWLSHVFNRVSILKQIENFAHQALESRGLKEDRLAYVGFSMGAVMALQIALAGSYEVAAVASISGIVPPFTRIRNKPPVLMQMGECDYIFCKKKEPPKTFSLKRLFQPLAKRLSIQHKQSVERLRKNNVDFIEKIYQGQDHIPKPKVFVEALDFVVKALSRS